MSLTEKELAELREVEARSRIVMDTVADAIITIDEESTILFANPAAEKIFGYAPDELRGSRLTMLMPDYLRHLHEAGMARYLETGRRHISWNGVELPGLHKSGAEIALEISFGEFRLDDRRYYTGIARDITERKRTEHRLAAQYEVTRQLAESSSLTEAAPRVIQSICENLGWETGSLWQVDHDEDVLYCFDLWHKPEMDLEEFVDLSMQRTFARGEGLPGRVWESGEPAWISNVVVNGNFPRAPAARRAGLHGAFAFPILMRGEVLGVVEFFSREERPPDQPLLDMMANIGSQIGQVIERRRAEDEQARLREEVINMQDELLVKLSTPLVPLTSQIMLMPLIGTIDSHRAQRMINTLLDGLSECRAPVAILDITGVSVVDTPVANRLIHAAHSARLLGTYVILTGVRGGVARSLVGLGVELAGVATRKTLQDGIAHALEHLRDDATKF